jgi:hypothetical protein
MMSPTVSTALDMTPIIVAAVNGAFLVVASIIGIIINNKVKDQNLARQLENAAKNGIGMLQQATDQMIESAHINIPNVPKEIAPAVQYMLDHAGEAITHFGITPEMLAEKIVARIGVLNIETNKAIAGNAQSPMIPEPLAPVPANVNGSKIPEKVELTLGNGKKD